MSKKPGDFQPQIPRKHYDLELAVLRAVTPHNVTLSRREIAEVCGVWWTSIAHVERTALRKMREGLAARGITRGALLP